MRQLNLQEKSVGVQHFVDVPFRLPPDHESCEFFTQKIIVHIRQEEGEDVYQRYCLYVFLI